MSQESLLVNTEEAKPDENKPGPKRTIKDVDARVASLEGLIARMAHQSGVSDNVLREYEIEPWKPTQKHMQKYK